MHGFIVGIDVGTTKVCALIADADEAGQLRILGVGLEPSQGMRKGVVVDVEQAGRSIALAVDKAQRSAGYEIGAAFVSLAGAHVSSVNSRGVVGIGGGSHGIGHESRELVRGSGLELAARSDVAVDLAASAGASTCFLVACRPGAASDLASIGLPTELLGTAIATDQKGTP